MASLPREPLQHDAPTTEEFVGAVIHTHERIHARLGAFLRRSGQAGPAGPGDDAEIIRAYCRAHGLDDEAGTERSHTRWLAV